MRSLLLQSRPEWSCSGDNCLLRDHWSVSLPKIGCDGCSSGPLLDDHCDIRHMTHAYNPSPWLGYQHCELHMVRDSFHIEYSNLFQVRSQRRRRSLPHHPSSMYGIQHSRPSKHQGLPGYEQDHLDQRPRMFLPQSYPPRLRDSFLAIPRIRQGDTSHRTQRPCTLPELIRY